jgi:hypothetical protein
MGEEVLSNYYVTGGWGTQGNYIARKVEVEFGTLVFKDNMGEVVAMVAANHWTKVEKTSS